MSGFRPNLTGQEGLLRSVDRGRPEVSAIWSKRYDQPLTDVARTFQDRRLRAKAQGQSLPADHRSPVA
jgi:hypothetical protein